MSQTKFTKSLLTVTLISSLFLTNLFAQSTNLLVQDKSGKIYEVVSYDNTSFTKNLKAKLYCGYKYIFSNTYCSYAPGQENQAPAINNNTVLNNNSVPVPNPIVTIPTVDYGNANSGQENQVNTYQPATTGNNNGGTTIVQPKQVVYQVIERAVPGPKGDKGDTGAPGVNGIDGINGGSYSYNTSPSPSFYSVAAPGGQYYGTQSPNPTYTNVNTDSITSKTINNSGNITTGSLNSAGPTNLNGQTNIASTTIGNANINNLTLNPIASGTTANPLLVRDPITGEVKQIDPASLVASNTTNSVSFDGSNISSTVNGVTSTTSLNNLNITSATSTNLFSSILSAITGYISNLFFDNATGTNLAITNIIGTNATFTNLSVNGPIVSPTVTSGDLVATNSATLATTTINGSLTTSGTNTLGGQTIANNLTSASATIASLKLDPIASGTTANPLLVRDPITGEVKQIDPSSLLASNTTNILSYTGGASNTMSSTVNGVISTTSINQLNAINLTGTTTSENIENSGNIISNLMSAVYGYFTNLFFDNATGTNIATTNITATGTANLATINTQTLNASTTNTDILNAASGTLGSISSNASGTTLTGTTTIGGVLINNADTINNGTTTFNGVVDLSNASVTFPNSPIPAATITNLVFENATGTNLTLQNASITNATVSNLFADILTALSAFFTNLTVTNATLTNATVTNLAVTGPSTLASTSISNLTLNPIASGTTANPLLVRDPITGEVKQIDPSSLLASNTTNVINYTGDASNSLVSTVNGVISTTTINTLNNLALTGSTTAQDLNVSGNTQVNNITGNNATFTNLAATDLNPTNITWTNATGTNTILTNATSTNFFASILNAITGYIQNLFFNNATGTNITATGTANLANIVNNTLTSNTATITDLTVDGTLTINPTPTSTTTTNTLLTIDPVTGEVLQMNVSDVNILTYLKDSVAASGTIAYIDETGATTTIDLTTLPNLTVTGNTSLATTTATQLTTSNINTTNITGTNATFTNLSVNGPITSPSITAGNLTATGTSNLATTTISNLTLNPIASGTTANPLLVRDPITGEVKQISASSLLASNTTNILSYTGGASNTISSTVNGVISTTSINQLNAINLTGTTTSENIQNSGNIISNLMSAVYGYFTNLFFTNATGTNLNIANIFGTNATFTNLDVTNLGQNTLTAIASNTTNTISYATSTSILTSIVNGKVSTTTILSSTQPTILGANGIDISTTSTSTTIALSQNATTTNFTTSNLTSTGTTNLTGTTTISGIFDIVGSAWDSLWAKITASTTNVISMSTTTSELTSTVNGKVATTTVNSASSTNIQIAEGLLVYSNGTQSIPSNAVTVITDLSNVIQNDFGASSLSGGTFTVPAGKEGWYTISSNVFVGNAGLQEATSRILINGTSVAIGRDTSVSQTQTQALTSSIEKYLNVGDTVSLNLIQNSPSSVTISPSSYLSLVHLGSTSANSFTLDYSTTTNTLTGNIGGMIATTSIISSASSTNIQIAEGLLVKRTPSQSIPSGSLTTVTDFTNIVKNDFGASSLSGGAFTVPAGKEGWYNIQAMYTSYANATIQAVRIRVNGIEVSSQQESHPPSGTISNAVNNTSVNKYLEPGDVVTVVVNQDSGAASVGAGSLSLVRLGSTAANSFTLDYSTTTNTLTGNIGGMVATTSIISSASSTNIQIAEGLYATAVAGAQSIAAVATVSFTNVVRNDFGAGSFTGSVFTVPTGKAGWYQVNSNVGTNAYVSAGRYGSMSIRGVATDMTVPEAGQAALVAGSQSFYLNEGDTVSVNFGHNDSVSHTLQASSALSILYLGSTALNSNTLTYSTSTGLLTSNVAGMVATTSIETSGFSTSTLTNTLTYSTSTNILTSDIGGVVATTAINSLNNLTLTGTTTANNLTVSGIFDIVGSAWDSLWAKITASTTNVISMSTTTSELTSTVNGKVATTTVNSASSTNIQIAEGLLVYSNGTQSIPSNAVTVITDLSNVIQNDFGASSLSGGTFTVPAGKEGWYTISSNVFVGNAGLQEATSRILINGTSVAIGRDTSVSQTQTQALTSSIEKYLNVGDTVSLNLIQNSPSSVTISPSSYLSLVHLGSTSANSFTLDYSTTTNTLTGNIGGMVATTSIETSGFSTSTLTNTLTYSTSTNILTSDISGVVATTTINNLAGGTTPAFKAKTLTNFTVNTGVVTVGDIGSVTFDTTGDLATATKRYQPSVPGKYIFTATTAYAGTCVVDQGQYSTYIRKNGVTNNTSRNAILVSGVAWGPIPTFTTIYDMNGTTDYVDVALLQNSGTNCASGFVFVEDFTGALINNPAIFSQASSTFAYTSIPEIAIGTTTSSGNALTVYGDIRVGTSGSNGCIQNFAGTALIGTCSSDQNLKTNIVELDLNNITNKLSSVKFVNYNWNQVAKDKYNRDVNATNTGIIAQNIEELFPELVSTDSKGYKVVDLSTLQWYVMSAVTNLINEVKKMSEEIVTKVIKTDMLCIGSTCINETQFKTMLNFTGSESSIYSSPATSSTSTSTINWAEGINASSTTEIVSTTTDIITSTTTPSTTTDTEAPGITLNGDQTINLNVGDTYTEQGATAFDTVDGDISTSIITTGTPDTTTAGTYEVIYTVTDNAGNIASKARSVIVNEVVVPPVDTTATEVATDTPATDTPTTEMTASSTTI